MAFIGLKVPHDAARLLEDVDVPGDRLAASDMHITVLYLGKGKTILDVAKAMVACREVTARQTPFDISVSSVSSFSMNKDDGYPVICPVESPDLHSMRDAIKASFSRLGIQFSEKYPEYKPHVTMSYVKPVEGIENFSYSAALPSPLSFSAMELVIWGGDRGDRTVHIGLPFTLSPIAKMASRIASGCRIL